MAAQVIRITPEVPLDLRLAYTEGRLTTGNRMMFSTTDDRVLFLPVAAGQVVQQKLRDLRIQPGDRVLIRQSISYPHGEKHVEWQVFRTTSPVGQQADGSFILAKQPGADCPEPTPEPVSNSAPVVDNTSAKHSSPSPYEHSGTSLQLIQRTNMLVDVYAAALAYAKQRHPGVTPDDVRTLLLSQIGRQE